MDIKSSKDFSDSPEVCCMAFAPQSSPTRGGEVIFITYSEDYPLPEGCDFYLVFEGQQQRHVTCAQPINSYTIRAVIPDHGCSEKVVLSVYCAKDKNLVCLSAQSFVYEVETEKIIAELLVESVLKPGLLECLVPLADISNGISKDLMDTLDRRITSAFECVDLSPSWVLGGKNEGSGQETLLHFATRLGFSQLATFLLDQPGADIVLSIHDKDGKSPEEIASDRGMRLLVDALKRGPGNRETQKKPKDTTKPQVKKTDIGTTTISSYKNQDQKPLEKDIEMLGEINSLVRDEIEIKKRMLKYKHSWPVKRKGKDLSTGDESTSDEEVKHLMARGEKMSKKPLYSSQSNHNNRTNPSSNRQLLEQNLRRLRDINEEIQRLRLVNAQRNSRDGSKGNERRQLSRRLSCPAFRGQEMLQVHLQAGRVVEEDKKLIPNGEIGPANKSDLLLRKGAIIRREKENLENQSNTSENVSSNVKLEDPKVSIVKDGPRPRSWADEDRSTSMQRTGLNRRVSSSLTDLRLSCGNGGDESETIIRQRGSDKSHLTANGALDSTEKNNLAEIIDSFKAKREENLNVLKSPTSSVTSLNDVDVDLGEREEIQDVNVKSNLTSKSLSYGCLADLDRAQVKPRPKRVGRMIDAAQKAQNRLSLEEFLQHDNDSADESEEAVSGSRIENGDKSKGLRRFSMLFSGSGNKTKPPKRELNTSKPPKREISGSKIDSKSRIRSSLRRGDKSGSKVGLGSLGNLSTEVKDKEAEKKDHLREPTPRSALGRRASGAINNKSEAAFPSPAMLTKMGTQTTSKSSLPVSRSHSSRSTSPLTFRRTTLSSEQDDDKSGASPDASGEDEDDVEVFPMEDLDDSDLEIKDEPEAWSVTVDKKLTKKMTAKEIKRQDVIHELIWTEVHYVRTLKIMQKIFYRGMVRIVGIQKETVDQVFPRLDDLMDINGTFLNLLKATEGPDSVVDCIGDVLVLQFDGPSGERMKEVYGEFCSHHIEAVELYKKLLKNDKKFADFIKKCNVNKLCRRLCIPECITLVTQRLSKYPLLIEAILKTTKESKSDYEMLKRSIRFVKEILHGVDNAIEEFEKQKKLADIKLKLDLKVTVTYKGGKKVKNLDFASNTSKLLYEGMLNWKTARGKLVETNVLILEDMLVFLQEKDQKYTLISFDQKAPVIRLRNLMVREVATDVKAIFLVSTSIAGPEMYEIVCESAKQKRKWMEVIREAVAKSPKDDSDDGAIIVTAEDERRKFIQKQASNLLDLADNVEVENKAKYLSDMQDILSQIEGLPKSKVDQDKRPDLAKIKENLQSAIKQLQSCLSEEEQYQSSAAGLDGSSLVLPNGPKRAETFSGFDNKNKLDLAKEQSVIRASSMKTERAVKTYNRQLPGVSGLPAPGSTSPSGGSPKSKHKRRESGGGGGWPFLRGKEDKSGSAGDLASSSSSSPNTTPTTSPAPGQEDATDTDGKGSAVRTRSPGGSLRFKPVRPSNYSMNSPSQNRRETFGKGKQLPDIDSRRQQTGQGSSKQNTKDNKGSSSPDVIYF